jgi:hypothetical protein
MEVINEAQPQANELAAIETTSRPPLNCLGRVDEVMLDK